MLKNIFSRFTLIGGLFRFLWRRRLWWLIPLMFFLVLIGSILVIAQTSVLGPFIYTLF